MNLLLVRHGHPNYQDDCLTPLGHEQAAKAAERLSGEGIDLIYASSCGRAYETAEHTARLIGKEITKLDFMRELRWGSDTGETLPHGGHPWLTAEYAVSLGYSLMDEAWTRRAPFSHNIVLSEVERIAAENDKWLESLGYRREGSGYRVIGADTDRTVALFSHGGSSSAALSRMLNLPFFYLCGTLCPGFTAITLLLFPNAPGALVSPRIGYANDIRHITAEKSTYQM